MDRYQALWSDGVVETWRADSDAAALRDVALWSPDERSGAHVAYLERITDAGVRVCVPVPVTA